MPGYRVHTVLNLSAAGVFAHTAVAKFEMQPALVGFAAASFIFATLMLSPDLDLKHSSPTKNWWLLRWIWRPYQWLFKHRGLSHSLLFSTVTRVVYLALVSATIFTLIAAGKGEAWGLDEALAQSLSGLSIPTDEWSALVAIGAGIWLSDLCHIAVDRVTSACKILIGG
jgi:uncharacterized metal-binding protein